ncbi:MAG: hypothetical protein RL272_977 [Candidatus Parcubacteria bacterium]
MKKKVPKKSPAAKSPAKPPAVGAAPAPKPAAPKAPAASAAVPAKPPAAAPKPAAAPVPGIKILIIDDDPFISGMYATRLVNDGFTVVTAPDGFQGLKKAAEEKPTIILCDVLMPKMDGFETLRRLKEDPALAKIPVMMLTSMSQKEDIDRGLRGGAVDYMVKTHTLPVEASSKIKSVLANLKR